MNFSIHHFTFIISPRYYYLFIRKTHSPRPPTTTHLHFTNHFWQIFDKVHAVTRVVGWWGGDGGGGEGEGVGGGGGEGLKGRCGPSRACQEDLWMGPRVGGGGRFGRVGVEWGGPYRSSGGARADGSRRGSRTEDANTTTIATHCHPPRDSPLDHRSYPPE